MVDIRCLGRFLPRLALIGPLAAALALAGCGRKGPLEAPPSAAIAQPVPHEPALGDDPALANGFLRPPQPEPVRPAGAPQQPAKKGFLLDWLM